MEAERWEVTGTTDVRVEPWKMNSVRTAPSCREVCVCVCINVSQYFTVCDWPLLMCSPDQVQRGPVTASLYLPFSPIVQ